MARVCIAGVGAVGATLAAHLAGAGETVSLLARGARLAQLRRDGLRVDFAGEMLEARLAVSDVPEFGIQDYVFVATKAQDLATLLPALSPLIGPKTAVVPLVNGIPWWYFQKAGGRFDGDSIDAVDPQGVLRDSIAATCLIGCVVYLTVQLAPSGLVSGLGGQRRLVVGEINHEASSRVDDLASLLSHAGIPTTPSRNIRNDLWTKVALNLATNPLSVVSETTLLDQFTDARLLPVVSAVIEETLRVARGHGATATMSLNEMIATGRKAGPFETSMLQDYRRGRQLELAAIGSSVLELARKIGEDMPAAKLIVDLCAYRAAQRSTLPT
jgi:2-dehydropantoate 2-reductase